MEVDNNLVEKMNQSCSLSSEEMASAEATKNRLGKCEVCDFNLAKYSCPKCEVKTCCLACIHIHKKELECNGIRDKTKYIPMRKITENDLMSDYTFLEECTQYVSARNSDVIKRYTKFNKSPVVHLAKLETAAKERTTKLKFLLQNFTKHKLNTTYYDWKSKVIYWRVEWHFVNAEDAKFVEERCCESNIIVALLDKYFTANGALGSGALQFYQARGVSNVRVLLKAEGIRKCKNRFFELDPKKSLRENFQNKTIIEFPVIYVIYSTDADDFDIIDTDDEDVNEETRKHEEIYFKKPANHSRASHGGRPGTTKDTNEATNERLQKPTPTNLPQNFLFTDENMELDGMSDDSDENFN